MKPEIFNYPPLTKKVIQLLSKIHPVFRKMFKELYFYSLLIKAEFPSLTEEECYEATFEFLKVIRTEMAKGNSIAFLEPIGIDRNGNEKVKLSRYGFRALEKIVSQKISKSN